VECNFLTPLGEQAEKVWSASRSQPFPPTQEAG
jgi:hypothetical protein